MQEVELQRLPFGLRQLLLRGASFTHPVFGDAGLESCHGPVENHRQPTLRLSGDPVWVNRLGRVAGWLLDPLDLDGRVEYADVYGIRTISLWRWRSYSSVEGMHWDWDTGESHGLGRDLKTLPDYRYDHPAVAITLALYNERNR